MLLEASAVDAPADAPTHPAAPLPLWAAALAAVAAGGAMLAAFPPVGLWWLAPVGVALLATAAHRRRARTGLLLGSLAGVAFFVPLLSWTGINVGALPWLLLSGLEALYLGLLGLATAVVSPVVDRWRWSWPLVTGALWVGQEALRDRTPFGGFPWGRLAFSQGESPLLGLAAVGGAPMVTFAVGVLGGLLALAAWRPYALRRVLVPVGVAALVALGPLAVPSPATTGVPSARVAIVQGNVPRLGLDFNAQRRAVLDNHISGTIALATRVSQGIEPQPDLVIWPENASDIDPLANADARAAIDGAAHAIRAPILVGGLLNGPGDHVRNVGIVWLPGSGPQEPYVKRHPVPFAEYVPLRDIARKISDKVDLVRSDFIGGDRPGVMRMGDVTIGDVICFEVAYDTIVRDVVTGGAQLLVVQTNNATFNAAEASQQLAMVRLRAVEHGRAALMASTVGISAFVAPDGTVTQATAFNTPAVISATVALPEGRTIATRFGGLPEFTLAGAALTIIACGVIIRRRARGAETVAEGQEE
ncbi:apolipoprotein N-acyltransferase [Luedemannella helvata]|uniref:Apolipoprotein N-acyltransferase n=1 Tax=Luedemannella helvata TaxID=349315 RepID=A0ABP4WCB1_9ACTN